MSELKLFDSELKIMEILWARGDINAKELAELLAAQVGWGKTTTYTVIKKCVDKGAIQRIEPGFVCHALLEKQQVQQQETDELIDKLYGGAPDALVASLLGSKKLSAEEIKRLKTLVEELA